MENLLRPEDVAELAGVDLETVRCWAVCGGGPPALCIGRGGKLHRFERAAVLEWLGARPPRAAARAPAPAANVVEGSPSAEAMLGRGKAEAAHIGGTEGRPRANRAHLPREPTEATTGAEPRASTTADRVPSSVDDEPWRALDLGEEADGELDARTHELDAMPAMTLEQIGEQLGITRERVRQIERRALMKVRCALAIEEQLGGRAAPILAGLRGKPLRQFEAAADSVDVG